MKDVKVITICGSLKFKDKIMEISEKLALQNNCILSIVYPVKENISDNELFILSEMHKIRIKMSDAIFVVNVNGYIGDGVKSEIEYAKSLNKEILYLEKN